jgi:hypothetical protein
MSRQTSSTRPSRGGGGPPSGAGRLSSVCARARAVRRKCERFVPARLETHVVSHPLREHAAGRSDMHLRRRAARPGSGSRSCRSARCCSPSRCRCLHSSRTPGSHIRWCCRSSIRSDRMRDPAPSGAREDQRAKRAGGRCRESRGDLRVSAGCRRERRPCGARRICRRLARIGCRSRGRPLRRTDPLRDRARRRARLTRGEPPLRRPGVRR